jgi:hypothetical protein
MRMEFITVSINDRKINEAIPIWIENISVTKQNNQQ